MGAIGRTQHSEREKEIISEIFNIYSEKERERGKVREQNKTIVHFLSNSLESRTDSRKYSRFRRRRVVVVVFSIVVKHQNY